MALLGIATLTCAKAPETEKISGALASGIQFYVIERLRNLFQHLQHNTRVRRDGRPDNSTILDRIVTLSKQIV
jgi:hypothetical protein